MGLSWTRGPTHERGYGSRESYIRDGLCLTDVAAVEWAVRGLQLTGAEVPVTLEQATEVGRKAAAEVMRSAPDQVGPGQGARTDIKPRDNVTKSDRGNQASYLASRLKRDHPEIAARVEAGEFRSIRAAAKAAGIIKEPTPEAVAEAAAWLALWIEDRSTPDERPEIEERLQSTGTRDIVKAIRERFPNSSQCSNGPGATRKKNTGSVGKRRLGW